ncbi:sigma-70 family RNA polymerase sigma factor [Actinoplanes sp. GCM10030250]|uniref:sigma-70 family RNA polymerase sigma factor n=1 Tax=Actinoplanes sp. GCM10030250 TaxID=3273376 RepID=UPI0036136A3D
MSFEAYRNLLFSVAYRILGSAADAEDAVQDTWVKWSAVKWSAVKGSAVKGSAVKGSATDHSRVAEPKAYLVRIVTNVALDRLRSARARRETYIGPWLPEPVLTSDHPPERSDMSGSDTSGNDAVVADSVSTGLLMLLESLSPLERAVFVLREAFGFSYREIAEAVERSEETVRQAAHRARGHVRDGRPRFPATRARHREVAERFFAAAGGGDINALMELLAPDVTLWTDGGGRVRQAMRPVTGADRVAAWLAGVGSRAYEGVEPADMSVRLAELNGTTGLIFHGAGRVLATLTLDLGPDGRIVALHNMANPEKLRSVSAGTIHVLPTDTVRP